MTGGGGVYADPAFDEQEERRAMRALDKTVRKEVLDERARCLAAVAMVQRALQATKRLRARASELNLYRYPAPLPTTRVELAVLEAQSHPLSLTS